MATKRWIGAAQDLPQHDEWTFSGTFATSDTVTVTCNKKSLILTLGTDVATTDVASETASMINATSATDDLTGTTSDETRNFGGQEIAEFTEMVASASGSVLTIKSTAGVPITYSVSVTTAGSGAVSSVNEIQAATGRNFVSNADNYEGGTLPVAADTIRADSGAVSMLYELDYFDTQGIDNISIIRTNEYQGDIGLPDVRTVGDKTYPEYRPTHLVLPITSSSGTQSHRLGDRYRTTSPKGSTRLDFGTNTGSSQGIIIYDAPNNGTDSPSSVYLEGGGTNLVIDAYRGSFSVGMRATGTAAQANTVFVTYATNRESDVVMRLGEYLTFTSGGTITMHGGEVYHWAAGVPHATIYSGTLSQLAQLNDVVIHPSGKLMHYGGDLASLVIRARNVRSGEVGWFDATQSSGSVITAAPVLSEGARFYDPNDTVSSNNGYDITQCSLEDIDFRTPAHKTWTPSAI